MKESSSVKHWGTVEKKQKGNVTFQNWDRRTTRSVVQDGKTRLVFEMPCLGISKGNVQCLNDKLPELWWISTFRDAVLKSLKGRRGEQISNIYCNITPLSLEGLGQECHHPALALLFPQFSITGDFNLHPEVSLCV